MNLIFYNPFRILGLPITASEREIAKQMNTLATYAEMGKVKSFDTDFSFLPSVRRTSETIEEARKQIEQSESKFLYSLFWFWKNNSVDELAFEILREGNTDKATGILEKAALACKHKVLKPIVSIENLISVSSNWFEVDNEDHLLHKDKDSYIVERKKETSGSVPCVNYELNYDDNWIIECDTQWTDGTDDIGYGIIFGREKGSYFTFEVSGNGYYCFGKHVEWAYTKLIPWKKNDIVNKWSTNHLQIEKVNNKLSFSINGTLVDAFQSEPFFGKSFGFSVNNNQKIIFRNFRFSKLVEDESYGEGLNVSSRNFSNVKNLSNLYLGISFARLNKDYFKKGIVLAKSIFQSEILIEYAKQIAGDKYNYNPEKAIQFYINDILDSTKSFLDQPNGISTKEIIDLFSAFPIEAKQYLNNKFVAKQIQSIDKEIEVSENKRKVSPSAATDAGKTLVNNTKADLEYLKKTLGVDDYQYQTISDKLSNAIVQCGIDAFNSCKNIKGDMDYAKGIKSEESYLNEYGLALNIAVTERAKEKAKENLDSCKDFIAKKHLFYCWFCDEKPKDETSKYEITMYKETSRSYFPRRVQYAYREVSIQRCMDCESVHNQKTDKNIFAPFGGALGGLMIGLFFGNGFIGLVIGALIGFFIKEALNSKESSKSVIKGTNHNTIRNHPVIHKMISEGWQFSKPVA